MTMPQKQQAMKPRHAGILALLLACSPSARASEYHVVDLGTLGGATTEVLGLNDRGQAVGWSRDADGRMQAFLWQNGTMTGLGFLPGGTTSVARGINNLGEIAGYAYVSTTNYHAFLLTNGTMTSLGTLGGPSSAGFAVNDQTHVTGWSQPPAGSGYITGPFWWREGEMMGIPPFHNKQTAPAWDINEDSRLAGFTVLDIPDSNRTWGYVWKDDNGNFAHDFGEMKLLGTLGGDYSEAYSINDAGQVVGWAGVTNTFRPHHAFLVTPSSGNWKLPNASNTDRTNTLMQSLGTLDGPTNNSYAYGINNHAWIVGTSSTSAGTNQAFLWREGVLTNLNHLIPASSGWVLTNAVGINVHNEIIGSGLFLGQPRAFMLRQLGRISGVESIGWTESVVLTNEFDEVVTQDVFHVEAQALQWSGIWGTNAAIPHVFTIEYCDALQTSNWAPFAPTAQWPTAGTIWTNLDYGAVSMRFFRVRAQPAE
jgi:probable HAF family extracellular repeat protein